MTRPGYRSRFIAAISILVALVCVGETAVLLLFARRVGEISRSSPTFQDELQAALRATAWQAACVGLVALALGVACAWWLSGRAFAELKEMDRAKADRLAEVSHELRTPLTAVSGYVEAAREGLLGDLDASQAAALGILERNVRRLRLLAERLLGAARSESGRLEIDLGPFRLERVLRQAVEAVSAVHGPGLDLRCEWPPDLPEAYGDADSIAQVVDNLLANAIKFSASGSPVILRARPVPNGIEVAVQDRGIGISEKDRARIFDRFFQVGGPSRGGSGVGLGLAIVRELLELHHSEIMLESRPGEGSTFRFVLGVAAGRAGKIPVDESRPPNGRRERRSR